MMRWISKLPLAAKLRVIIVYAAAVALLVASVLYMGGEALSLRRSRWCPSILPTVRSSRTRSPS